MTHRPDHAVRTIEYADAFATAREARAALAFLRTQDDYLGGRILSPAGHRAAYRVLAYFVDAEPVACPLPDGCRRRRLSPGALVDLADQRALHAARRALHRA